MLATRAAIEQFHSVRGNFYFSVCRLKCNLYSTSSPHQISVCGQSGPAPVATDPAHCI